LKLNRPHILLPLLILKKINPALLGRFEIGILTSDDDRYLSNALGFRTSALDSGSNRLSAWQLFVGLHERRNWNLDMVEKAVHDERGREGSIGWLNHTVRQELLARLMDEGGDRSSISLLSTYSKIVHSISGFS
jgi:hypothetical protein